MSKINFGGWHFSAPETLPATAAGILDLLAGESGLYVVLIYDSSCSPQPYRPLYFGESENIRGRATAAHEKHAAWSSKAGFMTPLYRALCPLPGRSKEQRQQIESALIAEYNPPCNERFSVDLSRLLGVR